MTAHKHSELIKRWADDTSLVILVQTGEEGGWVVSGKQLQPNWFEQDKYFLVCREHVDVCLHWLNGGEVERFYDGHKQEWSLVTLEQLFYSDVDYRKKPKLEKVKVWVGIAKTTSEHNWVTSVNDATFKHLSESYTARYTWTEVEVMKEVK
jgi:hypothetical protein